jgi:nitrogenase molybdenum-iron protein alpha/beta subunit
MPQVHLNGTRITLSRDALASVIQRYTGRGMVEARRVATQIIEGKRVSLYVDDFDAVYDLADMLSSMGVDAEPDEADY